MATTDDYPPPTSAGPMAVLRLTEFLTACLDRDEAAAHEAIEERRRVSRDGDDPDYKLMAWPDLGRPAVIIGGERVLREVEAKRAILTAHPVDERGYCTTCWTDRQVRSVDAPCPTWRHLAAIYRDHDDYRTEWRPR